MAMKYELTDGTGRGHRAMDLDWLVKRYENNVKNFGMSRDRFYIIDRQTKEKVWPIDKSQTMERYK